MARFKNITPTESWFATEQLHKEQLCLKKCGVYLNQVQDPQLKGAVQKMVDTCQRHVNSLQEIVGQSGTTMM